MVGALSYGKNDDRNLCARLAPNLHRLSQIYQHRRNTFNPDNLNEGLAEHKKAVSEALQGALAEVDSVLSDPGYKNVHQGVREVLAEATKRRLSSDLPTDTVAAKSVVEMLHYTLSPDFSKKHGDRADLARALLISKAEDFMKGHMKVSDWVKTLKTYTPATIPAPDPEQISIEHQFYYQERNLPLQPTYP